MSGSLVQYDEFAAKHAAAYAAFCTIYERENPPPVQPVVERESVFVPIAVVVMVLASVIVSGSRTVAEFGGGLIGLSAFVMVECGIVAFAFFRTRTGFTNKRMDDVRKLATLGLILAFVVGVGANIHAVLKAEGVGISDTVNTLILVLVGFSATTLAFISGDIMAVETLRNTYLVRKAQTDYQVALSEWRDGMNRAWDSRQKKWGIRVEKLSDETDKLPAPSTPSVYTDRQQTDSRQTGFGYSRQPSGAQTVVDWLTQHPEDAELPLRELGTRAGVNKDTAAKGRRAWQAQYTNGHEQHE